MATDGINIPSPSVFLRIDTSPPSGPSESSVQSKTKPVKKTAKPKAGPSIAQSAQAPVGEQPAKPKQSKSRNGCISCKAKRLKCDEEKPGCQQCARRKVECGGYKKDFKWRPFEDSIVKINIDRANNAQQQSRAGTVRSLEESEIPISLTSTGPSPAKAARIVTTPSTSKSSPSSKVATPTDKVQSGMITSKHVPRRSSTSTSPKTASPKAATGQRASTSPSAATQAAQIIPSPRSPTDGLQASTIHISPVESAALSYFDVSFDEAPLENGLSPTLTELMLPFVEPSPLLDDFVPFEMPSGLILPDLGELLESTNPSSAVLSTGNDDDDLQQLALIGPSLWTAIPEQMPGPIDYLYSEPDFAPDSPEMLCLRFDKLTCGILSVMDGPTENPWRNLIWPLAQQSPALYHAVAAMTAYHSSKDLPSLRVAGHEHKQKSIQYIHDGIRDNSMSDQAAIATALALGFSESWDQHTASGNTHIKGAQVLVKRALAEHRVNPLHGEDLARLKFLCNAWVYMDVIARLTAVDSDDSNDFDIPVQFSSGSAGTSDGFGIDFGMPIDARLDPLMGCASTLFPYIGRVANLVKKIFRSSSNSPSMISQANDLKLLLETWEPPEFIEPPEDPTSQVQHALQTAEAYRWATLLHLHQAVPEIPSATSAELGQRVLNYLATVPLVSRTVIVQIYPLMVAGCEASTIEDREWVKDRWSAMNARMRIGVVDKCVAVVEEVWRRRDVYEAQALQNRRRLVSTAELQASRAGGDNHKRPHIGFEAPPPRKSLVNGWNDAEAESARDEKVASERGSRAARGPMDPAYTVRGRLHWVGVMFEYGWEVLLG